MLHRTLALTLALLAAAATAACGNSAPAGPLGGSLLVSGDVVDFQSGTAVSGTATITTEALIPEPAITVEGASFVLDGVPENSAFQIVASVEGTHRQTYNTTEVFSDDVDGVTSFTVADSLLASMATAFGVTPDPAAGIVLLQLVDSAGAPKANVAASNIVLAGVTGSTPVKFLDANLAAAPALTTSSSSGWAVIFNVPAGVVTLGAAVNATATLAAPSSPVGANAVTLVRATVTDGMGPPLPTNVSFSGQIIPIFTARGCVACHSGGGPGKDLGGLQLDGGVMKVFKELTEEDPTRVTIATPETSLVLTMPSAESPSDRHPNVTFTGPQDPDYIKLLVWIREGAKNN